MPSKFFAKPYKNSMGKSQSFQKLLIEIFNVYGQNCVSHIVCHAYKNYLKIDHKNKWDIQTYKTLLSSRKSSNLQQCKDILYKFNPETIVDSETMSLFKKIKIYKNLTV